LQLNQIIRIFQIKDGGGLLRSKPSAEIPHYQIFPYVSPRFPPLKYFFPKKKRKSDYFFVLSKDTPPERVYPNRNLAYLS